MYCFSDSLQTIDVFTSVPSLSYHLLQATCLSVIPLGLLTLLNQMSERTNRTQLSVVSYNSNASSV